MPTGNPAPYQSIPSSYSWGQVFDFTRRQGAMSVAVSPADALMIIQKVSSYAYAKYMWPFTMATTMLGQIPCINLQQDYPAPDDLYRLSRAWLNVPTNTTGGYSPGIVPPVDDPSYAAYQAAVLSANYVASQSNGGGIPASITWPGSGSLDLVRRLPVNLIPTAYTGIRAISQMPNQSLLRLDAATAVADTQPFSLELEYQIRRPPVNAPTEKCWFPDEYLTMAQDGILYELYKYNNDPRAGIASFSVNGEVTYSGQYAVWMASMETAAQEDREGAVDSLLPASGLGTDGGGPWPFAGY